MLKLSKQRKSSRSSLWPTLFGKMVHWQSCTGYRIACAGMESTEQIEKTVETTLLQSFLNVLGCYVLNAPWGQFSPLLIREPEITKITLSRYSSSHVARWTARNLILFWFVQVRCKAWQYFTIHVLLHLLNDQFLDCWYTQNPDEWIFITKLWPLLVSLARRLALHLLLKQSWLAMTILEYWLCKSV